MVGAAELILELEKLKSRLSQSGDPLFSPPFPTLNVGVIAGGRAKNIIPGECRLTLEWRPLPGETAAGLLAEIQLQADRVVRRHPRLKISVEMQRSDEGVLSPAEAELVVCLERWSGRRASTVAFGTEAKEMTALGATAVVFGPGDIRVAHQTGEFVPIGEVERCREILGLAIQHFCMDPRPA